MSNQNDYLQDLAYFQNKHDIAVARGDATVIEKTKKQLELLTQAQAIYLQNQN